MITMTSLVRTARGQKCIQVKLMCHSTERAKTSKPLGIETLELQIPQSFYKRVKCSIWPFAVWSLTSLKASSSMMAQPHKSWFLQLFATFIPGCIYMQNEGNQCNMQGINHTLISVVTLKVGLGIVVRYNKGK